MDKANIENLVFKGGGIKGSAYAGSMQVLEHMQLLAGVVHIGGTSAGSITAAMLATGGGSAGLLDSVEHTDFAKFLDDKWGILGDAGRMISQYGMHTGHEFEAILKQFIKRFSGNETLTFAQLDELARTNPATFKRLSVVASNLTRQKSQVFNAQTHPDLPIWLAVRASMSIPFIFEPVQIDGDYHVDGGLAWNYPIDLYDTVTIDKKNGTCIRDSNPSTLGFFLESPAQVADGDTFKTDNYAIDSIKSYALAVSSYMYETANSRHMHLDDRKRTVFIDDLGVNGTDFSLPEKRIEKLIDSGRKAAESYFDLTGT